MTHEFTTQIMEILEKNFPGKSDIIFKNSELIRYINRKTKSASSGSKSRGSFGNLYAIYVLVEDFINKNPQSIAQYLNSNGASFSRLLERTRQLPFGKKIQNHSLNSRMNEEFRKFFPESETVPIIRNLSSQRYWINPDYIFLDLDGNIDLSRSIIQIIDKYVETKKSSLAKFLSQCEALMDIDPSGEGIADFIQSLLEPNVDARIFEIVAYAILKEKYLGEIVYFGLTADTIEEYALKLYKTGRTNANDGGIDYVMRPLGRFFQVTETLDVRKFFLDIDKVERFPITFVIKTNMPVEDINDIFYKDASKIYKVRSVVDSYMNSIEEIINIPKLSEILHYLIFEGRASSVLEEIIKQSRMEFHYEDAEADELE